MVRTVHETSVSEDTSGDTDDDDDDEEFNEWETDETSGEDTDKTTGNEDDDDDDEEEDTEMEEKGKSTSNAKASTTRSTLGKSSGAGSMVSKGKPTGRQSERTPPPKGKSTQGSLRPSQMASVDRGRPSKTNDSVRSSSVRPSQADTRRSRTLSQGGSRSSKRGDSQSKPRRSTSSSWAGQCTCSEEGESEQESEGDQDDICPMCQRAGTPAPRKPCYRKEAGFQSVQVPDATEVLKVEWSVKMPKQLYVSGGGSNLVWSPDVRSCLTTSSLIAGKVIGAVSENVPGGCQSGYNQQMMNPPGTFYPSGCGCHGGGGGYPQGSGFGMQQPYYGGFGYGQGMMPEPSMLSTSCYMPPQQSQMPYSEPPMCPSCGCPLMKCKKTLRTPCPAKRRSGKASKMSSKSSVMPGNSRRNQSRISRTSAMSKTSVGGTSNKRSAAGSNVKKSKSLSVSDSGENNETTESSKVEESETDDEEDEEEGEKTEEEEEEEESDAKG